MRWFPSGTFVSFVVKLLYFFSLMSTEACVFSQLMLSAQLPPIGVRAIVKFSTGDAVGETFISTRPSSSLSYLYGMPHSPVFLLMISVHLSAFGTVKIV